MTEKGQKHGAVILLCGDAGEYDEIATMLSVDGTLDIHQASLEEDLATVASRPEVDIMIGDSRAMKAYANLPCREANENDDRLLSPLLLLLADKMSAKEIGDSLEQGTDDFIERDLCQEVLLPKVRSLLCERRLRRNLWREEKRLAEANSVLERNFKELTSILLKILEVRVPGASDRSETAKEMADFVAQRLGIHETRRKQIIFAALLHEIGKIGLPDGVVSKHHFALPASLRPVFLQHVTVGSMVISTMTGYREAAEAVYHQLENFDGSGFPGEMMGDEIPMGSKILRAIVFQEELDAQGLSRDVVVERIRSAMHTTLDQNIANLVIEFLLAQERETGPREVKVPIDQLTVGMTVAQDIFAASGVKLLPKGVPLHEKTLALLLERNETDPIIGGVYIFTDGT